MNGCSLHRLGLCPPCQEHEQAQLDAALAQWQAVQDTLFGVSPNERNRR